MQSYVGLVVSQNWFFLNKSYPYFSLWIYSSKEVHRVSSVIHDPFNKITVQDEIYPVSTRWVEWAETLDVPACPEKAHIDLVAFALPSTGLDVLTGHSTYGQHYDTYDTIGRKMSWQKIKALSVRFSETHHLISQPY